MVLRFFKVFSNWFPSREEWRRWSLPDKLTTIAFYITVIPIFLYAAVEVRDFLAEKINVKAVDVRSNLGLPEYKSISGGDIHGVYPSVNSVIPSSFLARINEEVANSIESYFLPGLLEYNVRYEVGVLSSELVSFKVYQYYYYEGAANGNESEFAYNFNPKNKTHIDFFDVFDVRKNAFQGLKGLITKAVESKCDSGVFPDLINDASYVPRFFIKANGVDFVFSEYEITPGVCGSFTLFFSFDDVRKYLRWDGPLGYLAPASGEWEAGKHFMNAIKSAIQNK